MTRCYFCKGKVLRRRVRHVHEWGPQVIIFEDVPAEVCTQCGETYFDPDTLKAMDAATLGENEPRRHVQVPVFSLAS